MLSQNLKARHRPKVKAPVLSFTNRETALETTVLIVMKAGEQAWPRALSLVWDCRSFG